MFRKAGDVVFTDVNRDSGEGVVEFSTREDMENAVRKMDDSEFRVRVGCVVCMRLVCMRAGRVADPFLALLALHGLIWSMKNHVPGYRTVSTTVRSCVCVCGTALRTVALARALARAVTAIARIATVTTTAAATTVRTTFTACTVTVLLVLHLTSVISACSVGVRVL